MKGEAYEVEIRELGMVYQLVSRGRHGDIPKIVRFSPLQLPGYYNLGFGDMVEGPDEVDDFARSVYGDMEKVLATAVNTVLTFTMLHPGSVSFALGSTQARTRLYQMGIARYWDMIAAHFSVFGHGATGWEPFQKGKRYRAFLAERKR